MREWDPGKVPSVSQPRSKIVNRRIHIFVVFGLAMGLLLPVALAQKPPAPPPPSGNPPPTQPNSPGNSLPSTSQPEPAEDFVMYLLGRVATDDGTRLPNNVMVERVCNSGVRQQVYAGPEGDFSMQLGSMINSALDASADGSSQPSVPGKFSETGIPRRALAACELRASVSGFQSRSISLVDLDPASKSVEVGTIVVHRRAKIEGQTLNAAAYRAPRDAVTAFEKGLDAERSGKLANARKYFEKAVAIYPKYAHAWFELGAVLEKENEKEAARAAYTRATTADARFMPPYVSLALMAYKAEDWKEVIHFTGPLLALDPFKDIAGYTIDLDPFDTAEAYFYNAVANYQLSNFADAERSAVRAEHMLARSPQHHLLLAEIFARKNDYASAISEMRAYLDLVPRGQNADLARARLEELQRQSDSKASTPKNDQN